jgi:hypothetical protein
LREGLFADLWEQFRPIVREAMGVTAAILFVLTTGINFGTWVYPDIARYFDPLMCIHFAVIAMFFVYSYSFPKAQRSFQVPPWIQSVSKVMSAYILVTLVFFFFSWTPGGTDKHRAFEFVKDIPLEKTARWHSSEELIELRLFSIFWMAGSLQIAADSFYRKFTTRFGRYDAVVKKL